MEQRISIKDLEPKAYPSMYELNRYLSSASLDTRLKDLIKIRASQINGCAYCIETHSADALKHGEDQQDFRFECLVGISAVYKQGKGCVGYDRRNNINC